MENINDAVSFESGYFYGFEHGYAQAKKELNQKNTTYAGTVSNGGFAGKTITPHDHPISQAAASTERAI